jgi:hypothetical protein
MINVYPFYKLFSFTSFSQKAIFSPQLLSALSLWERAGVRKKIAPKAAQSAGL